MRQRLRSHLTYAVSACLCLALLGAAFAQAGEPLDPVGPANLGSDASGAAAKQFVPGELLVRFRDSAAPARREAVVSGFGGKVERGLAVPGVVVLARVPTGTGVLRAARLAERSDAVVYAEPNFIYEATAKPNDPLFGQLWGLDNTGQTIDPRDIVDEWDDFGGRVEDYLKLSSPRNALYTRRVAAQRLADYLAFPIPDWRLAPTFEDDYFQATELLGQKLEKLTSDLNGADARQFGFCFWCD
jgi:hypothetical protein